MRTFLALLLLFPLAATAEPDAHFQSLGFLAGHCWKGTFPDGKQTDEHCYEWDYGGKFLRDRHIVGNGPYGGETIYWWDAEARMLSYQYFNADGGVSRGTVEARDGALQFPEERYSGENGVQVFRSQWRQDGSDAYLVLTEMQVKDTWKEAWRMRLAKQEKPELPR